MDAMKLLGGLLNNKSLSSGLGSQLLGSILGGGGGQQQSGGGGLGSLLGILGGGGGAAAGGLGGLLNSVMGGGSQPEPQAQAAPAPTQTQSVSQQDAAVLMIRAMVNAAKSDGRIDQAEQENIVSKLGDLDQAEINFLKQEFAAPLDVEGFARSIPQGLEQQIYAISLTSIELDSQNEAQYLGQLAQGMGMNPQACNAIHEQAGAPKIFG